MKYLIDTNVMSEVRKPRGDRRVHAWYASVRSEDRYLSVLAIGEVRKGIELARAHDPSKADVFEHWLQDLETNFRERIVEVDQEVGDVWGRMSATRPRPPIDTLQAATAPVHGMTFVTRNERHVADLGVPILNPFT
jgi:predicted nucleic acid-binding protein